MRRNVYDYNKIYPNRNQPFKIIDDWVDPYHDHLLLIRFEDENIKGEHTELEINRRRLSGKDPYIKDPYQPSICGTCCIGNTSARLPNNGPMKPEYNLYTGMVHRCYDEKSESHKYYINTEVSDEWKCFEDFERTLPEVENYELWKENPGCFQLDKDFKQPNCDHKVYSVETCKFVPSLDNNIEKSLRKLDKKKDDLPLGVFRGDSETSYIAKFNNTHIGTFSDPDVAGYAVALHIKAQGKNNEYHLSILNRIPDISELTTKRVTYENHEKNTLYDIYDENADLTFEEKFDDNYDYYQYD